MKSFTFLLSLATLSFFIISGCDSSSLTAIESAEVETYSSSEALSKGGSHSKATGEFSWFNTQNNTIRHARFNAHQDANGSRPDRGEMEYWYDDGRGSFTFDVECVNIVGNRATAGGRVTRGDGVFASWVGIYGLFGVKDGGTPGRNGDTFRFGRPAGDPCPSIKNGFEFIGGAPLTSGNLVVHN